MGDFDFDGDDHRREVETGAWGPWGGNHAQALTDQGYDPPFDRSPVPVPPGWHGGDVKQTGGMVMVRSWHTTEKPPGRTQARRREHEYEVGYNARSEGVQLTRYKWDPGYGFYVHDEIMEQRDVPRRTDKAQARAARKMMQRNHNLTR